ncbi:MAG: pyridoxal-phosphate dependent enzyme [Myxococcota bacterium]|nr:pyridoxal-phosphate dependent enzyme [Myxococcota bacterium]
MTANQPNYAANLDSIRAAADRIEPYAHRTPILTSRTIDDLTGHMVYFKCENLQRVGAFKFRGAMNALLCAVQTHPPPAVVTHSSGNHAQAVALAARLLGIPAHIVMPTNAPEVKRRAVEGYGATIHPCAPNVRARESTADQVCAETGGRLIPPYNHPHVIAGQGTVGLEMYQEVSDLDVVIVPVGGGGLLSGVTLAFRALSPTTRVYAAEPRGADDAYRSKASGRLVPQTDPRTIADGLRTSLGDLTWPVVRDLVDDVLLVEEADIVTWMKFIWERLKLVIEPSAAVGVAALARHQARWPKGSRVGVVLCGGNVDLEQLPW